MTGLVNKQRVAQLLVGSLDSLLCNVAPHVFEHAGLTVKALQISGRIVRAINACLESLSTSAHHAIGCAKNLQLLDSGM